MTKEEVLELVKDHADPRVTNIWEKTGSRTPDEFYGTNLTNLKEISKKVGKNHTLALELWNSGVHEGKLLATMIDQPKKVTEPQLDAQIEECRTWDLVDKYCQNIVCKTPYVNAKIEDWIDREEEMIKRAGYILLWIKSKRDEDFNDADYEKHLSKIHQEIKTAPNWVKEAMNYALIGIGGKNRNLNQKAIKIAHEIGEINIDYGETSCKAPDVRTALMSDKIVSKI